MFRLLVALCTTSLALSSIAAAQELNSAAIQRAGLRAGDEVRLRAGGFRNEYRLLDIRENALLVRATLADSAALPVELQLTDIAHLDVKRPRSTGAGAWHGLKRGFLIGAGIGAVIGLASGDDETV